jgi:hypothetical protein
MTDDDVEALWPAMCRNRISGSEQCSNACPACARQARAAITTIRKRDAAALREFMKDQGIRRPWPADWLEARA